MSLTILHQPEGTVVRETHPTGVRHYRRHQNGSWATCDHKEPWVTTRSIPQHIRDAVEDEPGPSKMRVT